MNYKLTVWLDELDDTPVLSTLLTNVDDMEYDDVQIFKAHAAMAFEHAANKKVYVDLEECY